MSRGHGSPRGWELRNTAVGGHPTYSVDEVVHHCVTMPGAVARTSTFALSKVTAPFVLAIAE